MLRENSNGNGTRQHTKPRHTNTTMPRREKYTTKAGRRKSSNRSSNECVGSGTIPKTAMRTAPPAIKIVPRIIHGEKTSPRIRRAKKAFHRSETAPRGARITTGSEAIWTREPIRFDRIKIANPSNHSLLNDYCVLDTRHIKSLFTNGRRCSTRW